MAIFCRPCGHFFGLNTELTSEKPKTRRSVDGFRLITFLTLLESSDAGCYIFDLARTTPVPRSSAPDA
jgi:hypothetical protein